MCITRLETWHQCGHVDPEVLHARNDISRRSRLLALACKADCVMVATHALRNRMTEEMDLYTDFADRHRFSTAEAGTDGQRSLPKSAADLWKSVRSVYRHNRYDLQAAGSWISRESCRPVGFSTECLYGGLCCLMLPQTASIRHRVPISASPIRFCRSDAAGLKHRAPVLPSRSSFVYPPGEFPHRLSEWS